MTPSEDRRRVDEILIRRMDDFMTELRERDSQQRETTTALWNRVNANTDGIHAVSERVTGIEAREGECLKYTTHRAGIVSSLVSAIVAGIAYGVGLVLNKEH